MAARQYQSPLVSFVFRKNKMQKSVKRLSKATLNKMAPGVKNVASSTKSNSHWSLGLVASMNDPESKLEEDDQIVIIKDKYPKARFHYLVLTKQDISSISKLNRDHLDLLKHMQTVADKYVNKHKEYEFKVGYHALPSMYRLHLHVISTDFDSPCLKTRQHWNTFTTPYFISSKDVIKQVEESGHVPININKNQQYLKAALKCHKCPYIPKTMSDLKKHIIEHISSK